MSVVRLVREGLPHMRERGFGRIGNVASSSIKQPIEDLILSNTFRAGVAGLAKSLSSELALDDILVNTLGPGRISTERSASIDIAQAERLGMVVEKVRGGVESQIPLGRLRNARGVREGGRVHGCQRSTYYTSPLRGYHFRFWKGKLASERKIVDLILGIR